tara:strand:- start:34 stop:1077 length:1044 start_codon:yes stop_codon:yes gene_type:complete
MYNTESSIKQIDLVRHLVRLFLYLCFKFRIIINCFLAIRFKLLNLIFIVILSSTFGINNSCAEEGAEEKGEKGLDTVLSVLERLTCETEGVGNLLRSEFSHTCIPAPFFTFLIANIISPGLYANTFLRVNMVDAKAFETGEEALKNPCARGNRIDFNDQKLSFSMCNNIKLASVRGQAIASTVIVIAKAFLNNTDPWDDIQDAWKISKSQYHEKFLNQREGDIGVMYDFGVASPIPVFPWKVIKQNDKMCVATMSFGGWIPIGCKYIKEPYPVSIYSEFMDLNLEGIEKLAKKSSLTTCGNMGGCYKRAYNNSRTGIVMTGPLIECVKEMIAKLMVSNSVCGFECKM